MLNFNACTNTQADELLKRLKADLVKKASKALSDAIELKADESSAIKLAEDTDENDLIQLIKDYQAHIKKLRITLKIAETSNNLITVNNSKIEIQQTQQALEKKIATYYRITRIPFVTINNYKLLPAALYRLKSQKRRLCNKDYKTIVYGYGGYIGSETATKTISNLRAKAVSKWLKKNTDCQMISDGLGIDIRAREIQDIKLPQDKRDSILEESRYVRIYTHR